MLSFIAHGLCGLAPGHSETAQLKIPTAMIFVIDFDGTVAPNDTVDSLLGRFAADAWRDIEQKWVVGEINSRACMSQQIELIAADRKTLEEFFDAIEVDSVFVDFIRYVSPFAKIAIVSDGLDYPIQRAMHKVDMSALAIFANKMSFRPNGLGISFPYSSDVCAAGSGVCKCDVARSLDSDVVVLIGDGRSDYCLARTADFVFAKGSLQRFCQSENISHTPFTSFGDILTLLQRWDIRELVEPDAKRYAT